MLENIKMLLGIDSADTSKDRLINYYINSVTKKVLNYCNISDLAEEAESFVENKVILILKASDTPNNVKSVQRGDTQISYSEQKSQSELLNLTEDDKKELNSFRKVKFI